MQSRLTKQLIQILVFLGILYIIHAINVAMGMALTQYGIVPLSVSGLRGIIFCPLLHGDWRHLAANTVPLGVLLTLLAINKKEKLWTMTAVLWVASGIGIWLVGRWGTKGGPAPYQIGASSLIYAIAAYFIMAAWRTRHIGAMITAVVVSFLYGGIFWGMFPSGAPGVSWEGHLAGAVAGVLVGAIMHPKREKPALPAATPPSANPPAAW